MKLFGVPVKVDVSFFVLAGLLALGRMSEPVLLVVWLLVVFFSILVHEFGHALAARAFGQSASIILYSMGGLTYHHGDAPLHPVKNLAVSLAGPAAGLLFGALVYLAGPAVLGGGDSLVLAVAYSDLIWVNVGWGIFNLLPVLPLDGGNVVATIESWITGKREPLFSYAVSLLAASAIGLWALSAGSLWIAFLGAWFAYSNGSSLWQVWQHRRDARLEPSLAEAHEAVNAGDFDRAFQLLTRIGREAKSEAVKKEAARLVVFAHFREGDLERAEHELNKFQALYGQDPYLHGLIRVGRDDAASAVPDLQAAFDQGPTKELGLLLFRALIDTERYADAATLCSHTALSEVALPMLVELQDKSFHAGDFEVSARAGKDAFALQPDPSVAYNTACAFARSGDAGPALAWLRQALDAGYEDAGQLSTDPDLESLRTLPEFKLLLDRLRGGGNVAAS